MIASTPSALPIAARESFQQIAAAFPDVLWLIDVIEERMLYVSPAYEKVWGRSCQSLYDDPHSWLDAVHPDDNDRALIFFNRDTCERLLRSSVPHSPPRRCRTLDSRPRLCHS